MSFHLGKESSTVDIQGRVRLPINKISTALHCEGKITITDAEVEAGAP